MQLQVDPPILALDAPHVQHEATARRMTGFDDPGVFMESRRRAMQGEGISVGGGYVSSVK